MNGFCFLVCVLVVIVNVLIVSVSVSTNIFYFCDIVLDMYNMRMEIVIEKN